MRLLLDEMFSPVIAVQLRQRGHDVEAVLEKPNLMGQPDVVVFAAARSENQVIVTENVPDFRRIAKEETQRGNIHQGFIFTVNQRFPRRERATVGRLVTALEAVLNSDVDLTGTEYWLR